VATITISNSAGVTLTKTLSAGDVQRFLTAYRDILKLTGATDAQVFTAWADNIFASARAIVRAYETKLATDAAAAQQTDIVLT